MSFSNIKVVISARNIGREGGLGFRAGRGILATPLSLSLFLFFSLAHHRLYGCKAGLLEDVYQPCEENKETPCLKLNHGQLAREHDSCLLGLRGDLMRCESSLSPCMLA